MTTPCTNVDRALKAPKLPTSFRVPIDLLADIEAFRKQAGVSRNEMICRLLLVALALHKAGEGQ